jgi:hypothetical protein
MSFARSCLNARMDRQGVVCERWFNEAMGRVEAQNLSCSGDLCPAFYACSADLKLDIVECMTRNRHRQRDC